MFNLRKEDESANNYCRISKKSYTKMDYHVYLNESIKDVHYYCDLFEILRGAQEDDEIFIHINNGGGYIATSIQIMNEMRHSPATVHTIINGEASSAASLIFLSGDVSHVMPGSYMLCHWFSTGTMGKGNEVKSHVNFADRHWQTVFKDIYDGFLTDEEFNKLVEGVDYWMDDDEICKRLENRSKFHKKLQKEEKLKEEEKVINKPKKRTK